MSAPWMCDEEVRRSRRWQRLGEIAAVVILGAGLLLAWADHRANVPDPSPERGDRLGSVRQGGRALVGTHPGPGIPGGPRGP